MHLVCTTEKLCRRIRSYAAFGLTWHMALQLESTTQGNIWWWWGSTLVKATSNRKGKLFIYVAESKLDRFMSQEHFCIGSSWNFALATCSPPRENSSSYKSSHVLKLLWKNEKKGGWRCDKFSNCHEAAWSLCPLVWWLFCNPSRHGIPLAIRRHLQRHGVINLRCHFEEWPLMDTSVELCAC